MTPGSSGRGGAPRGLRWALVLAALAALAYSGVLLEAAVGYPLDPRRTYLSELAASDQPTRWLFRGADLLAGVCVLLAVALSRRAARPARGLTGWAAAAPRATLAAAAVFGAATVAEVLAPLRCASGGSAACVRLLAGGGGGVLHEVHLLTSVVANLGAVATAAGLLVLSVGRGRRPRWAPALTAASALLLTVPVAVLSLLDELGLPAPGGVGIVQRAQTVASSLVLLFLVRATTRAGTAPGHPRRGPAAGRAA